MGYLEDLGVPLSELRWVHNCNNSIRVHETAAGVILLEVIKIDMQLFNQDCLKAISMVIKRQTAKRGTPATLVLAFSELALPSASTISIFSRFLTFISEGMQNKQVGVNLYLLGLTVGSALYKMLLTTKNASIAQLVGMELVPVGDWTEIE